MSGALRRRSRNGVDWLEARISGATVCFTTRKGGFSFPPYDSLNLGILTADDRKTVLRNREHAAQALEIDGERIMMGLQVHGSRIIRHVDPAEKGHYLKPVDDPPQADGLVTSIAGLPLLVLAADCLPVAVVGPGGLAMLHCGWRGLAGTLIPDAVAAVQAESAVIGPGIEPCCFEVGADVEEAFADLGGGLISSGYCDLTAVAERVLERSGVKEIQSSRICTYCDSEDFFSHRRDQRSTGRQAGIAWLD